MSVPSAEAKLLTCPQCGGDFFLHARNVRLHRRRGTVPICSDCRFPKKASADRIAMREWWLQRLSLDEIFEIGWMIGLIPEHGEPSRRPQEAA